MMMSCTEPTPVSRPDPSDPFVPRRVSTRCVRRSNGPSMKRLQTEGTSNLVLVSCVGQDGYEVSGSGKDLFKKFMRISRAVCVKWVWPCMQLF